MHQIYNLCFFMYKQRVHATVKCGNFESWHQQRVTTKVKRGNFDSWHQVRLIKKRVIFTHNNVWTKYSGSITEYACVVSVLLVSDDEANAKMNVAVRVVRVESTRTRDVKRGNFDCWHQ